MAYFNMIKINGADVIRPNDFTPERTDLYAAEITTMSGKKIADLIGWKYGDMTLQWDALPEAQLQTLLSMSGTNTLQFLDADGVEHTENIIRVSEIASATRFDGPEGSPLWKNVTIAISFLDAHN